MEALIARFPGLRQLDLSRCKYPDEAALCSVLPGLKQLESLTLKDCGLTPRLGGTLAATLAQAPRLQVLNLTQNNLQGRGATLLADTLRPRGLTHLNLRDNGITLDGTLALAAALRRNCGLLELDLSENGELGGYAAAAALSGALVHNTTLRRLNLGGCLLGDDGAAALAQGLPVFPALTFLSLYRSGLTDAGAGELANALAQESAGTFAELELRGNPGIRLAGVVALLTAAEANSALRSLEVDGPPVGRTGGAGTEAAEAAAAAVTALGELLAERRADVA